ncbi:sperm flagellar protein 1-like [Selaginella moellendorffii]|uniref:sperm flagellar protein 1-like n=1 Tax=Selaginella moellendorffii TaxID=88036 RepID=UPI000D1C4F0B|nr:sperm flagellar protein 1-like [Selaginella moellendorffii]|eukprot:XP_024533905.1 sperm flagellar protein 1-like [Selaginella moellendorffii]
MDVAPEELPGLYSWVDGIPLSRPKRNIARDFSDGVLAAEVVAHYCPRLVDIHNYSAANSLAQKIYNWNTLNNKVFRRLSFSLTKEDVEAVANAENQMIERILKLLKYKIAKYRPIKTESMKHEPNGHGMMEKFVQSPKRTDSPERQEKDGMNESQKDIQLRELRETIELLEAKVMKLEQLVSLKDHKIQVMQTFTCKRCSKRLAVFCPPWVGHGARQAVVTRNGDHVDECLGFLAKASLGRSGMDFKEVGGRRVEG